MVQGVMATSMAAVTSRPPAARATADFGFWILDLGLGPVGSAIRASFPNPRPPTPNPSSGPRPPPPNPSSLPTAYCLPPTTEQIQSAAKGKKATATGRARAV